MAQRSVWSRFWSKVSFPRGARGCWLWTGAMSKSGYGQFSPTMGHCARAHRVAYEWRYGTMPPGTVLDHVAAKGCTNRNCVNPEHLEPVSVGENVRRGKLVTINITKTHCPHGHEYSGYNVIFNHLGHRQCRQCGVESMRRKAKERLDASAI